VQDNYWHEMHWLVRTPNIELIGGKYYCFNYGMMTTGIIYTYENGKFVEQKNSNIRNSWYEYGRTVTDIDIDKAVTEMKPVQK
ncbi:MAG: hypothetical protein K2G04_09430, partial [Oscillospiraceae bacterium]|nr:hypothetical protein [Oscillospiraceae bacterium]